MYINKDWKWIIIGTDNSFRYCGQYYYLHRVSSFQLWRLDDPFSWTLTVSSNSKIQKWIISRLNINQTRYKSLKFEEGELEQFLDELDLMMELLYGK